MMKRILAPLVGVLWAGIAVAAQAPDTPVVTGPNNAQVPIGNTLVTPTGGTQQRLGDALKVTIPGGTIFPGIINFQGTGTSGQYDAQISVTGGGSQAGQGLLVSKSAVQQMQTYDGTVQFQFGYTPGATDYWSGQGGLSGIGGVLYATNGNPATGGNVNGNFVTQNAGNFIFSTGSGPAFEIDDPGAAATTLFVVKPGISSAVGPMLSSTQNATLNGSSGSTNGASGFGAVLAYGGMTQAIGAPIGSGVPQTGYIQLGGSSGDAFGHISCLGSTNATCYIAAAGVGSIILANSSGTHGTFLNSIANTAVDSPIFRSSSTTAPIIIAGLSSASIAVGSGNVGTSATKGFLMIPYGAGAPTGVPTTVSDGVPMYFDTTNLKLCIYSASAWKCSGAFS